MPCDERLAAVCRKEGHNPVNHSAQSWDDGCPKVGTGTGRGLAQTHPGQHTQLLKFLESKKTKQILAIAVLKLRLWPKLEQTLQPNDLQPFFPLLIRLKPLFEEIECTLLRNCAP